MLTILSVNFIKRNLIILELILLFVSISNPVIAQTADAKLYPYDLANFNPDAKISEDEYATTLVLPSSADNKPMVELSWGHNNTHLAVGITGKLTGWIGFGQNTEGSGMLGANMIISSVTGDNLTIADYYAVGNTEPLKDGNQSSTLQANSAGKDDGTTTTVEFIIPMTSNDVDGQDKSWEVGGVYSFFVSIHATSDTLQYHTSRTNVLSVEVTDDDLPAERYITLGQASYETNPVGAVAISLTLFVVIAIFIKQNRNVNTL